MHPYTYTPNIYLRCGWSSDVMGLYDRPLYTGRSIAWCFGDWLDDSSERGLFLNGGALLGFLTVCPVQRYPLRSL